MRTALRYGGVRGQMVAIGGVAVLVALVVALPSAASSGSVTLTGMGATRKAWFAHHAVDPNPKLSRGCCFLPRQKDGHDRYYDVMYDRSHVFLYDMAFVPSISARVASALMAHELPSDAHLVRSKTKATCAQFDYRSAMLKRATGHPVVGIEFSSDFVGGPYRSGVVRSVLLSNFAVTPSGC
jgi:hypothetical protein